jgi:DNA-binding transcriptional ArsR family regulator
MRRADRPLSRAKQLIVALLHENPQGLRESELAQCARGQLRRSTLYIHLGELLDMGLVQARKDTTVELPVLVRQSIYSLTKRGLRQPVQEGLDVLLGAAG